MSERRIRDVLDAIVDEVIDYVQPGEEQDIANLPKAVERMRFENFRLKRDLARMRGERDPVDPRKIEQRPTRWNQLEVDDDSWPPAPGERR